MRDEIFYKFAHASGLKSLVIGGPGIRSRLGSLPVYDGGPAREARSSSTKWSSRESTAGAAAHTRRLTAGRGASRGSSIPSVLLRRGSDSENLPHSYRFRCVCESTDLSSAEEK